MAFSPSRRTAPELVQTPNERARYPERAHEVVGPYILLHFKYDYRPDSATIVASYRRKLSLQLSSQSLIAQYRRNAIA